MNSDTGGILGVFGFIVSMAGVIYTAINHKKIRCRCCGKDLDMSVDVDTTEATWDIDKVQDGGFNGIPHLFKLSFDVAMLGDANGNAFDANTSTYYNNYA